jgi:hypothetical protein
MRDYDNLKDPATAPWGLTFTFDAYNKMLRGFVPTSMDIKWQYCRSSLQELDEERDNFTHYRSWQALPDGGHGLGYNRRDSMAQTARTLTNQRGKREARCCGYIEQVSAVRIEKT